MSERSEMRGTKQLRSPELGSNVSTGRESHEIKHIVANRVYKLVHSGPKGVDVRQFEDTVIKDIAVFVGPATPTNRLGRGQDVIDPYQASQQARLRSQARWRLIASEWPDG